MDKIIFGEIIVKNNPNGVVAMIGYKLIGYALWMKDKRPDTVYIYSLAVDEKYRGKSVGSQLIKKSVNLLAKSSAVILMISCEKHLIPFYRKNGFVKPRTDYYNSSVPGVTRMIYKIK